MSESKKRGRPIIEGSKRQTRLAKWAAMRQSGIVIKPGRPVVEKKDIIKEPELAVVN